MGGAQPLFALAFRAWPLLVISGYSDLPVPRDVEGFFSKPFQVDRIITLLHRLYAEKACA